jgi:hypothetical protein
MNTEICSHIFDPIEGFEYRHGTQCCVSSASRVHSRVTDARKAKRLAWIRTCSAFMRRDARWHRE